MVQQVAVGYFPYAVTVSQDGTTVLVSNWGVTEYKFANPGYGQHWPAEFSAGQSPTTRWMATMFRSPTRPATIRRPHPFQFCRAPGGDGSQAQLWSGRSIKGIRWMIITSSATLTRPRWRLFAAEERNCCTSPRSNSDTIAIMDLQGNKIANIELPLIPPSTALTKAFMEPIRTRSRFRRTTRARTSPKPASTRSRCSTPPTRPARS